MTTPTSLPPSAIMPRTDFWIRSMSWFITNLVSAFLLPPLNLLLVAGIGLWLWHKRPFIARAVARHLVRPAVAALHALHRRGIAAPIGRRTLRHRHQQTAGRCHRGAGRRHLFPRAGIWRRHGEQGDTGTPAFCRQAAPRNRQADLWSPAASRWATAFPKDSR